MHAARVFEKGAFYYIQRKYLWPMVNNYYIVQKREILQSFRGYPGCLPVTDIEYGTRSVMEETTEKIVHFSLVQVSEVANSNAVEKEGLKRCLEFLERAGRLASNSQVFNFD